MLFGDALSTKQQLEKKSFFRSFVNNNSKINNAPL